jgi:hypothetical protein
VISSAARKSLELRLTEQRQQKRLPLPYSVSLWRPSDGAFTRTKTENLSCQGFFCCSQEPYEMGDVLLATLEVRAPVEQGQKSACLVLHCTVEVVRVQSGGIACRLKDYTIIHGAS